jgi:predicted anti-sigma-YlaC factor YlaD
MHEPVKGRIEDYLHGSTPLPEVDEHLRQCSSCRLELMAMKKHAETLRSLKSPRQVEPSAGFYARVLQRIESQPLPSVWSLFGESMFAKRLTYASITFLVLLGTYFVSSTEPQQPLASSAPEAIMAADDQSPSVGGDQQKDREAILVNLATYEE